MKPKNFPERKRQRQLKALKRLVKTHRYDSRVFLVEREIDTLMSRTEHSLRDVRTKKRRA